MVTPEDSLVFSSTQRMTVRKRPDLTARRQTYLGKSYWVVKEPIGPNYFRFQDEEYELLQKIDGNTSLDELKEWFESTFQPQKIMLEELQQFIDMLQKSDLVITDEPSQEEELKKRYAAQKKKKQRSVLYFRFKVFDPDPFLNWCYPKIRWLFSVPFFIFSILLVLSALTFVTVQFDLFYSKLPDFHSFFGPANGLWLIVILCLIKVLHVFGNGLMCKHFGVECHDMGIIIKLLSPCLYSDLSDSWMLPNKWKRAAIGAAGMYVEVILAAIATFVWWFTLPGMLNMICLNIILVSVVSTVMFNANPLLCYDGYHILSDLVEIPNLRQKANSVVRRTAAKWFFGIKPPDDPFLPQRGRIFLAMYSITAGIYRCFVFLLIIWFICEIRKLYGLL